MVAAAVSLNSLSIALGVVGAPVATGVSVREYQLKARAQRAETEIQLARLFAELVPIANGRGPAHLSEAAATAIAAAKPSFTADDLVRAAVTLPVGAATQAAAIASLGRLGATYEPLRAPARAALESLAYVTDPDVKAAREAALASLPA